VYVSFIQSNIYYLVPQRRDSLFRLSKAMKISNIVQPKQCLPYNSRFESSELCVQYNVYCSCYQ